MADTKEVILNIKTTFSDNLKALANLQKQLDDLKIAELQLNAAVKSGTKTREEADVELEAIASQVRNVKTQQREYRKEIDNEIKTHQANEGSIKQMRLELSKMRKEYEAMSKTDRESDKGTEMLNKISQTTEELKKLEQAQGDWRREVGHYQNALMDLDPHIAKLLRGFKDLSGGTMDFGVAMKNAIPMLKQFGAQLLKLATNPVVLSIIAIVTVLKQLVDQFKKTDDAMTALQQLFASLSPIIEVFVGVLDGTVKILTKVIGAVTKAVTAIVSLVPAFGEASKAAQEYVRTMDELEDKERNYSVQTAKNNVQIARARNKAAQADQYTTEERKAALEEAIALEKQNLKMELDVAETRWRLAVQDAERRHDTTDETKNNIAQLEAAYYQAIANTEAGMRRLHSSIAKFNSDIRKDTINTWKSIIGNSAYTTAEWKKADADYKKLADNAEKRAKDLAERAADLAAAGLDNTQLLEASKQAAKEAEEYRNGQKTEHKKYLDALKSLSQSYYSNELSARRAYEDAVIEMMDDSLEKQLQLVENQYKREIEDLQHKLKTEEHLTKEARKAIQDLIALREKQMNKQRILTEAKYWGEVREMAKNTIDEIFNYNKKITDSDPNRVVGGFMDEITEQMTTIQTDFTKESQFLSDQYIKMFSSMATVIEKQLADPAVEMSDKVRKAMSTLVSEKDTLKSLDSFLLRWENLRIELQMTNDDVLEFTNLTKPYLTQINTLYGALAAMPQRYTEYVSNIVINKTKESVEKIRKTILDNLDFSGVKSNIVDAVDEIIQYTDEALAKAPNPYLYRLKYGIGEDVTVPETEDTEVNVTVNAEYANEEAKEAIQGVEGINGISGPIHISLQWDIDTDDKDLKKRFEEMGEKYGTDFDRSFSGILTMISGSSNTDEQINYIVTHYEEAINKIQTINDDLYKAYEQTNDERFYFARIDESVVIPQMRRIYELAKANSSDYINWDRQRAEIEGRYVGEADRELKIQHDLLGLEIQKAQKDKEAYENRIKYLNSIRDKVGELETEYNRVSAEESANISNLNEQLVVLANQRQGFDDTTDAETVRKNAEETARIETEIAAARERIRAALEQLSQMGFMSQDEVDKAMEQYATAVINTNNTIVNNTAKQAQTTTQIWLNSFNKVVGGLGQISSAFNGLFTEMGELSDKWNAFAEATAYFTIGVDLATAIAEAVAAGAGMPYPYNLAAIASGVAAVVAAVGSAFAVYNQYHKPKYADGGLIGGRYAQTRREGRRDDIDIKASKGEYIINAEAVKKIGVEYLDLLNYGKIKIPKPKTNYADGGYVSGNTFKTVNAQINMDAMNNMLVDAMAQIQPVVSVREIARVNNRVNVKDGISKNK